jgi:hypothetical protein
MALLLGMFLLLAGDYAFQNDNAGVPTDTGDAQTYVADGGGGYPPK